MEHRAKTLGVVIGRFQVAELHAGHRHLITYALRENDSVAIVLGKSSALLSKRNPLPYSMRAKAIQKAFPHIRVLPQNDHPSDAVWSERLDSLLAKEFPDADIRLYASRDSFHPHYSGKLPVIVVPTISDVSGTSERLAAAAAAEWDTSFLRGMIAAQHYRPDLSYQAVDIAVVRYPELEILLGQKETDGDQWRLIGGFVDPTDQSLEEAASRELKEEAGHLMTHELAYLGSYRVRDWRYRGECDQIMTALFLTYHLGGSIRAGDDIARIAWHPLSTALERIVESHRPLMERILDKVTPTQKESS